MSEPHTVTELPSASAHAPEARGAFPLAVAAIDVGSNAIRFVCAEFTSASEFRVLAEERVAVRLGHDVFLTGRLTEDARDAGTAALRGFRTRLDELGIQRYRAVATSAVREASNGEAFVQRVREEAGIELEAITGSEEARLVHVAVRSRIPMADGRWILVDLGGGSVEVSLVDEKGIHWSESHTMGSVRLLEELSVAGAEPGRFRQLLEEYTATLRIPHEVGQWKIRGLVATGGNIETLARLAGAAPREDRVSVLPAATLRATIGTLSTLSFRQRVEQLGLREDRADVILPAAMVYERVAKIARVDSMLVPHVGVKEGVLIDLVEDLTRHGSHAERADEQAHAGSLVLGRRYMFDEPHGAHVAALAVGLFDQLREVHGLGPDDRRILRAAAVLHDVGMYVSQKKHHRHSHYLIANSELPGFSPREIALVAAVARYHRKGEPGLHQPEFQSLPEEERVRVVRLAALMRLAAALDKEHRQRVSGVRIVVRGSTASLHLHGSGDLLLERWGLQRNKALFERAFGLELRVVDGTGA